MSSLWMFYEEQRKAREWHYRWWHSDSITVGSNLVIEYTACNRFH